MSSTGWMVGVLDNGVITCLHSSGFYVAGFDSKNAAFFWLRCFLLDQQAQRRQEERRAERARIRILAQMAPHGKVS